MTKTELLQLILTVSDDFLDRVVTRAEPKKELTLLHEQLRKYPEFAENAALIYAMPTKVNTSTDFLLVGILNCNKLIRKLGLIAPEAERPKPRDPHTYYSKHNANPL